jgi:hypothetical protein
MSEQSKGREQDREFSLDRAFLASDVLPDVASSYGTQIRDIKDAVKDADVVLDTNVLLLPYGAGTDSLNAITKVYDALTTGKRLHLPAQVVREFLKNRPVKIGDLYKGIADKASRLQVPQLSYPILEAIPEFQEIKKSLTGIAGHVKDLQKANGGLLRTIRSWEWNDPVSLAYRKHLPASIVFEPKLDREKTLGELKRRYELAIPPGYKDAAKDDYGVGDYLVWKTILAIGARNKRDLIFVSGEEKADWQHRSDGTPLLPRYELLDEYMRSSGGKALYIVPLSRLLELLNVADRSVKEIKQEETRAIEAASVVEVVCPYCSSKVTCTLSQPLGSSAVPRCPACEGRFQVHRTRSGVTVHEAAEGYRQRESLAVAASERLGQQLEAVECRLPRVRFARARAACSAS